MPASKSIVPKKGKTKESGRKTGSLIIPNGSMNELNEGVSPLEKQGKTSKASAKALQKKEEKSKETSSSTGDQNNLLKSDLLNLFLDAVTGVQVQSGKSETVPKENTQMMSSLQKQQRSKQLGNSNGKNPNGATQIPSNVSSSNQPNIDFSASSLLNLFTTAMVKNMEGVPQSNPGISQHQGGVQSGSNAASSHSVIASLKQKKYQTEELKRRSSELREEGHSTIKKKVKSGKNSQNDENSRGNAMFQAMALSNRPAGESHSVLHNGTVYNYPNLSTRNDFITRVDKLNDKFILHHSTLAPLEVNRIYLADEVQRKINMSKIISSLTLQQIAQHQRESSYQALQKVSKLIDLSNKQQQKLSQAANKEAATFSEGTFNNQVQERKNSLQVNSHGKAINHVTSTQQQQLLHQQQQLNLFANVPQTQSSNALEQNPANDVSKPNFIQYALLHLQQQQQQQRNGNDSSLEELTKNQSSLFDNQPQTNQVQTQSISDLLSKDSKQLTSKIEEESSIDGEVEENCIPGDDDDDKILEENSKKQITNNEVKEEEQEQDQVEELQQNEYQQHFDTSREQVDQEQTENEIVSQLVDQNEQEEEEIKDENKFGVKDQLLKQDSEASASFSVHENLEESKNSVESMEIHPLNELAKIGEMSERKEDISEAEDQSNIQSTYK